MKPRMRVRTPDSKGSNQSSRSFGRFRRRFCGIRFHGVISIGATTPIRYHSRDGALTPRVFLSSPLVELQTVAVLSQR